MSKERRVRKWFERERRPHQKCGRSMTKQSFAEECDIRNIMKRWKNTGFNPHPGPGTPMYGDFTIVSDFRDMLETVRSAESKFDRLPKAVRKACDNDPRVFMELVQDPESLAELGELGLPGVPKEVPAEGSPGGGTSGPSAPPGEPNKAEPTVSDPAPDGDQRSVPT